MALTINDVFPDMRVMLNDNSRANYGQAVGAVGTVVRTSGTNDVLVRFDTDSHGYGDLYVSLASLDMADLSKITDLDLYRRAVVRVLIKHKKINGWCGSAEMLACQLGVRDLLPVQRTIIHTVHTYATAWPGEADNVVIRRGVQALDDPNTRYRQDSTVGDITEDWSETEVDYRMADVQTVEDFQRIMTEVALYGARQYEVGGVTDFLLECGIDRESMVERRTVTVTCTTEVEVEVMPDDDVAEAAMNALEDGYTFQYLTEDCPY